MTKIDMLNTQRAEKFTALCALVPVTLAMASCHS